MDRTARTAGRQGEDVVRRLIALLAVVGCAQLGSPPGGPEDHAAPHLLRISPDTNALNARPKSVELRFDEVINERPGRGGGELSGLFLVSPRRGRVDVKWHRSRIEIRPRGGWRPNTTYTITQLAGVTDLRGNADSLEHKYIFSTGPNRSPALIKGQVFDWVAGKVAPKAYVEAIHLPDSLTFGEYADSLGRFVVHYVTPGTYLVRAFVDANSNRTLDRRELFDSATVQVPTRYRMRCWHSCMTALASASRRWNCATRSRSASDSTGRCGPECRCVSRSSRSRRPIRPSSRSRP